MDIMFLIVMNGLRGLEFPLSLDPPTLFDDAGRVGSDVLVSLLE